MRPTVSRSALLLAAALTCTALVPLRAETPAADAATTAAAAAAAPSDNLPSITVTTVASRPIEDHVLASGLITAVETVSVVPLIDGQPIDSLEVDVGDRVTKGQVLARLSDATLTLSQSQLKAQLASARASADEASRTARRSAALLAQGSTSTAANDQAQANLATAEAQLAAVQAQLDSVELQLSRTQVIAPVDGIVTQRNAQVGAVASAAGSPMFVLMRDGALELRADVAEADLPRVAVGQKAKITLAAAIPPLSGSLRLVEPTLDVATRLGRARILLDDPGAVRAGMYGEADILVAAHQALAIPVTAIGSEGADATVMKVVAGTVHRQVVTTGIRDGGWVEILTGLSAGDRIVAKAGAFVADGDKIHPVDSATN